MLRKRASVETDESPLTTPEYELLLKFVKSSTRNSASANLIEQELLTSLAFALQRNARQC